MAKIKEIFRENKTLFISFFVLIALYLFAEQQRHKNVNLDAAATKVSDTVKEADTYIPAGYVLVPITIRNTDALSGLIENYGVVDLYTNEENGTLRSVAQKVKLIRAPLNPNQFAVLVEESLAKEIMKINQPFSIVLQNRNVLKADLEKNILLPPESKSASIQGRQTAVEKIGIEGEEKVKHIVEKKPQIRVQIEYYNKKIL